MRLSKCTAGLTKCVKLTQRDVVEMERCNCNVTRSPCVLVEEAKRIQSNLSYQAQVSTELNKNRAAHATLDTGPAFDRFKSKVSS